MPVHAKIQILLADDDALRRDGLLAVLAGHPLYEVVAEASDGNAALKSIRSERPDVAVVDLNLPKLHGIELVRRVRSEALGTKIIILSGTSDDEIINEVMRAGGDGYLLKNGPARHLIDAIAYVSDGGQYFSPQLHRDGRERHLREEPARPLQAEEPVSGTEAEEEQDRTEPASRTDPARRGRRTTRSGSDAGRFRARIREEAPADLEERDYEIMSMMADGIRPILDRLDEIDTRVAQMETGDEPVPSDPRGWLTSQFADTVRSQRGGHEIALLGRSVNELETRLPELIEDAVTRRFHQMADKLQQEIEETHVRTIETFVKNIQVKLVKRVSALETDMSKQAEAMSQLRDYSQRTEDNLSRLISGVDRLAQELPQRLAAAFEAQPGNQTFAEPAVRRGPSSDYILDEQMAHPARVAVRRSRSSRKTKRMLAAAAVLVALLGGLVWAVIRLTRKVPDQPVGTTTAEVGQPAEKPKPLAANADTKTRMLAAQESMDRKDYTVAEDIYKQIVKAEPGNIDALKALASVLYRQEKIDESAAILDRLSKN